MTAFAFVTPKDKRTLSNLLHAQHFMLKTIKTMYFKNPSIILLFRHYTIKCTITEFESTTKKVMQNVFAIM